MPGAAEARSSGQSAVFSPILQSSCSRDSAVLTLHCSMTVRPLTSHTRYWGPSQTFVTKTGGVKYITDQVSGRYDI